MRPPRTFLCNAPLEDCRRAIAMATIDLHAPRAAAHPRTGKWLGTETLNGFILWPARLTHLEVTVALTSDGNMTLVQAHPNPSSGILALLLFGPILFMISMPIPFALGWTILAAFLFTLHRRTLHRFLRRLGSILPNVTRCPSCGYDLRATPERCPECGAAPTKALA